MIDRRTPVAAGTAVGFALLCAVSVGYGAPPPGASAAAPPPASYPAAGSALGALFQQPGEGADSPAGESAAAPAIPGAGTSSAVPGSAPSAPPDERPGWRLTGEGEWLNDLTAEVFRGGQLVRVGPGTVPSLARTEASAAPPGSQPAQRSVDASDWQQVAMLAMILIALAITGVLAFRAASSKLNL